jgi:hypothetical protein
MTLSLEQYYSLSSREDTEMSEPGRNEAYRGSLSQESMDVEKEGVPSRWR